MRDEIKLGPFTFEYDRDRGEMYVAVGEDGGNMIEVHNPDEWDEFYAAAAMGATVVQAMVPEPKAGPGEDARIAAAMSRMTQTLQMLGALSFQSYVLAMSIGRCLHDPQMHEVVRKDASDVENQAHELNKFIRRLLYERAQEG